MIAMPRYLVTWEKEIEWVVEGSDPSTVEECAKGFDPKPYDCCSDFVVSVFPIGPSTLKSPPDAVVFNGAMVHPDDAEEEWQRLVELERQREIKEFEDLSGNLFEDQDLIEFRKGIYNE